MRDNKLYSSKKIECDALIQRYIEYKKRIKTYILENLVDKQKQVLIRNENDRKCDISIIGACVPFKVFEPTDEIMKNTVEIEHYVNEIVKNSREDFMDLPVKNDSFYLVDVIENIKKYYTDKLQTIHTNFFVEDFNNCILKGDKDRIIEVIQNVIENAIKYGDGKEIKINFSEEEDCKLISILNTGCELKEEDLPHIFDSFYRGSNSKKQEGSGLGLYICKQLMHKMDGDIFAGIKENNNFEVTVVIRKA